MNVTFGKNGLLLVFFFYLEGDALSVIHLDLQTNVVVEPSEVPASPALYLHLRIHLY